VLLVHESLSPEGANERVYLACKDGAITLVEGEAEVEIPEAILARIFARYGNPLEPSVRIEGPSLELPSGARITHLRFLARYDVIAKDYLVLERTGEEPLVELATGIVAALQHLARGAQE
jgi:hypothetical protein